MWEIFAREKACYYVDSSLAADWSLEKAIEELRSAWMLIENENKEKNARNRSKKSK